MTTATASSRRPTDAEWSAHLPRICQLYYGQRFTLEETQRTLREETGFDATLRMYKDRIRNMAVHPKKICMQKYQAMGIVAEDNQQRGISVYFVGPSGFQFFKRTPAQITKQLRRPHSLQPITLTEAHHYLQQSNIQVVVEHAVQPSQPANARGSEQIRSDIAQNPYSGFVESGQDLSSTGSESGDNISTRRPRHQSQPVSLPRRYADEASRVRLHSHPGGGTTASTVTSSSRAEHRGEMLSLAGIRLRPDRSWLSSSRPPEEMEDAYDFCAEFDALSTGSPSTPSTPVDHPSQLSRMLPPPTASHRRRIAIECAAPFFLSCFPTNSAAHRVGFSKSAAMEKFRYILTTTPENQYFLPLLNWMSTVLSSNGHMEPLKTFVDECCQVLNGCPEFGFPIATPYRYLLAHCSDDYESLALHGSHFPAGTERLVQLYGPSHPNVLVNEYYRAWHEMPKPAGWSVARQILETCLLKSEAVMGHRNLMTVNCLAMLGRGFSENNLHDRARSIFQDIIERLGSTAEPLRAYRLLIVQRLAFEEEHLGNLHAAQGHHTEVYDGRLQYLTALNPETKAAMCSLASILRKRGLLAEARKIELDYDRTYDEQSTTELWQRQDTAGLKFLGTECHRG